MSFTINSSELSRFGYSRESTFGTPIADNGAFKEIIVPRGINIDPAVVKSDLDQNRDSRIFHLADSHNDTFTGPVTMTIPEMICTKDRFCDMLYAVTQNRVSEGLVGTGYSKVFNMHSSQPDFTANAGYFFTLGWRGPVTAKHIKVTSCIVKSLEIDIDKTVSGEKEMIYLKNIVIIGKKMAQASTFSGTWTPPAMSGVYYPHAMVFTDITNTNATPAWSKFSLKIDNGAVIKDRDTDGTAKTYFLNPPKPDAVTIHMEHWYNGDAATRDFLAALIADTNLNAKLQTGTVDTDGYIQIAWFGVVVGNPNPKEDDKQMITPVDYRVGDTVAALGLTITVADAISQGGA